MLGSYSSHVELMLSQERRVPFKSFPGSKRICRCWIMAGPLLGVYGAYVGPMLMNVRLLEAMLGPYSSRVVELMLLSQERHIPFKPLRRVWIMPGPCWAYTEPMLGLC